LPQTYCEGKKKVPVLWFLLLRKKGKVATLFLEKLSCSQPSRGKGEVSHLRVLLFSGLVRGGGGEKNLALFLGIAISGGGGERERQGAFSSSARK